MSRNGLLVLLIFSFISLAQPAQEVVQLFLDHPESDENIHAFLEYWWQEHQKSDVDGQQVIEEIYHIEGLSKLQYAIIIKKCFSSFRRTADAKSPDGVYSYSFFCDMCHLMNTQIIVGDVRPRSKNLSTAFVQKNLMNSLDKDNPALNDGYILLCYLSGYLRASGIVVWDPNAQVDFQEEPPIFKEDEFGDTASTATVESFSSDGLREKVDEAVWDPNAQVDFQEEPPIFKEDESGDTASTATVESFSSDVAPRQDAALFNNTGLRLAAGSVVGGLVAAILARFFWGKKLKRLQARQADLVKRGVQDSALNGPIESLKRTLPWRVAGCGLFGAIVGACAQASIECAYSK